MKRRSPVRVLLALVGMQVILGSAAEQAAPPEPRAALPPIRHVFLILLENHNYASTFGPDSPATYLARTLTSQGALLSQYYGIGHASLGNYIALVSGQAPNAATQDDCEIYTEFRLTAPRLDAHGQALGSGCVYPKIVPSLPDQLEAAGLTWKAYMEDMGADPKRERATCGHALLGTEDLTELASAADKYAAKHNPFVYFHSIIDDPQRCDSHVVNLARLAKDLRTAETTPRYVFITPNLCNDGHDPECIDGGPGGLEAADRFLQRWVPRILGSAAYADGGLLIITFDESEGSGPEGSTACCGERGLPGAAHPPGFNGPGGGRVGAVLLSSYIAPGTVSTLPYNHYSLLRSVEDFFGLTHLGYAAEPDLRSFGSDVFTAAAPVPDRAAPTPPPPGAQSRSR